VGGDDHEGEDALGDDVHDGVGHNLVRVRRPQGGACQRDSDRAPPTH
jgi:signal transduction histidine kinase